MSVPRCRILLLALFLCFVSLLAAPLTNSAWAESAAVTDSADNTNSVIPDAGVPARQAAETLSLDDRINQWIRPVSQAVSGLVFYAVEWRDADGDKQRVPLIVFWLIGGGLLLTIIFRGVNFWGLGHAINVARGRYSKPGAPGEISHFQALTAALSGTVGLGNIAGVAAAISLGGPGALVWMIGAALIGMATKFAECALGVKYRQLDPGGGVSGGAMYYLSKGLAEQGWPKAGKILAVFFAICCIGGSLGGGNMFQANQAYHQFIYITGGESSPLREHGWAFGLMMAAVVGLVIVGGIKGITRVTEKVVPFMGMLYLIAGVVIILVNVDQLPMAVEAIITGAFTPEAGYGGIIGVMIWGIQRATFSNEAGIGSAPIAYSAVKTDQPVSAGFISLLEPLVDTVIICSITALVIVISGVYADSTGLKGVEMTSSAFATVIDWFPYVLAIAILLFAFSTLITWSYYGLKSWTYLFGESRRTDTSFKLLFLSFIVLGSSAQLGEVIAFSDAMIFAMAIPNLIGVFVLSGGLRRDLRAYWDQVAEPAR